MSHQERLTPLQRLLPWILVLAVAVALCGIPRMVRAESGLASRMAPIQWKLILGESSANNYRPMVIKISANGTFFIGGYTYGLAAASPEAAWITAVSATGQKLWEKIYTASSKVEALVPTIDGGVALLVSDETSIRFLRVDALGDVIVEKEFSKAVDFPRSLQAVAGIVEVNGGYAFASVVGTGSEAGVAFIRTDASGTITKKLFYEGTADFSPREILSTRDGGCLIYGDYFDAAGNISFSLLKLDSSGNKQWQRPEAGYAITAPEAPPAGDWMVDEWLQRVNETADGFTLLTGHNYTTKTAVNGIRNINSIRVIKLSPANQVISDKAMLISPAASAAAPASQPRGQIISLVANAWKTDGEAYAWPVMVGDGIQFNLHLLKTTATEKVSDTIMADYDCPDDDLAMFANGSIIPTPDKGVVVLTTSSAPWDEPASTHYETKLIKLAPPAQRRVPVTIGRVDAAKGLDVAAYLKPGRTMVPLRFISEALGGAVDWDQATSTARITLNGRLITVTLGSTNARAGSDIVTLLVAPEVKSGRTFLGLRDLANVLGGDAVWDEATKTAEIILP